MSDYISGDSGRPGSDYNDTSGDSGRPGSFGNSRSRNRKSPLMSFIVFALILVIGCGGAYLFIFQKSGISVLPGGDVPSLGVEYADMMTNSDNRNPNRQKLRFSGQNKTFTIATFADLHFGEVIADNPNWGKIADALSLGYMKLFLQLEKPDLVVLTGDQITGENIPVGNSTDNYATKAYGNIVSGLENQNIPWASAYGNHDMGKAFKREDLLLAELEYKNSRSQLGPSSITGITNYWIPIYGSDIKNKNMNGDIEVPKVILWFFDSNGDYSISVEEGKKSTGILKDQVDWFKQEHDNIVSRYGKAVPGLAFFHIPPIEFNDLNVKFPAGCVGSLHAEVPFAVEAQDFGFMSALKSVGSIQSAYAGHDHGSTWCCPVKTTSSLKTPMRVCMCRHSGQGGYSDSTWDKGSRIIQIDENDLWTSKTWIRLQTGKVIDKQ